MVGLCVPVCLSVYLRLHACLPVCLLEQQHLLTLCDSPALSAPYPDSPPSCLLSSQGTRKGAEARATERQGWSGWATLWCCWRQRSRLGAGAVVLPSSDPRWENQRDQGDQVLVCGCRPCRMSGTFITTEGESLKEKHGVERRVKHGVDRREQVAARGLELAMMP